MIVDCALYVDGRRRPLELDEDTLARLRADTAAPADATGSAGAAGGAREGEPDGSTFVWLGLHEPDAEEMARLARIFGLHHLAVEDSLSHHQRPKVEPYDDMLFVVIRTLWYVEERDEVETGQVSMFIGRDFVVTVRQGAGVELGTVRSDLESRAHLLQHGPSAVVYAVCDRVVDGYEEVAAELANDVDEVEESVFSPGRSHDSRRIYVLKREILETRRAVHPLRVPMQRFGTGSYPFVHADAGTFFRDVADHVTRVAETVDGLDLLLSTALEAHLARISVEQNADMRRISAWVAIAAVGTLVAGVYGMNFRHMPELGWEYGYAFAWGIMLVAALALYRLFKRSGWL